MTVAYLLSFFLLGQMHYIPGIASYDACKALALDLSQRHKGVEAEYVREGTCTRYQVAVSQW